jgi:hypothetical protein
MGDNNALIVQILAVVLFLFFCFATYMNTKTWRAAHVTFMFLTFLAAIVFAVYAAATLKTRRAWVAAVEKLEADAAARTAEATTLLYGDTKLPRETLGVRDYREAIAREIVGRGRVWRNVAFVGAQAGEAHPETGDATYTVRLSTVPPDMPEGARVEPNQITVDTVLYAFKDVSGNQPPHTKYAYVGEFRATEAADTSVTLESLLPLTELEQGLVNGNQLWILYERMPVDSHELFTRDDANPADFLTPELFHSPEAHQRAVREFLRDGMTKEEMEADRQKHGEPPLTPDQLQNRLFAKVKFLKEQTVKVDAPDAIAAASGDAQKFDRSGQALDPLLRRGEDVTFKVGDEAEIIYSGFVENGVVIQAGAEELLRDGIVEILQTVYRRPLHDYAYEFRHMAARREQMRASLRLVNHEIAVVTQEIENARQNTQARTAEKAKLTEDQMRLEHESKQIAEYAQQVDEAFRSARADLSRLYRENAALHARIVAANDELTREIENRVASPTALER